MDGLQCGQARAPRTWVYAVGRGEATRGQYSHTASARGSERGRLVALANPASRTAKGSPSRADVCLRHHLPAFPGATCPFPRETEERLTLPRPALGLASSVPGGAWVCPAGEGGFTWNRAVPPLTQDPWVSL